MFAAGAAGVTGPQAVFGGALLFRLDASNTGSLTLSGADVTQWNDISGNGLNAASAGNPPAYSATALGGKPGVTFNGSTQSLNLSSVASFPTSTNACTVIAITSLLTAGNYPQLFNYGKASADKARGIAGIAGNGFVGATWYADDHETAVSWVTTQRLIIAQFQNSTADISIDGGANTTLTATGTPTVDASGNTGTLGVNLTGAGPGNFVLQEFMVVNGTVTSSQIAAMQAYRTAKW